MSAGYVPSQYLVNIVDLQNYITKITGLDALGRLSNSVANIQKMVNFDQKRLFVNTISKYDQTPIQVTDDINLSNVNLYQNGSLFIGSAGSSTSSIQSTSGISLSSGTTRIYLTSSIVGSETAIGFQVGGRDVFTIDGQGGAKYFMSTTTVPGKNTFWISSATLIADKVQFGMEAPNAGKVLTSMDVSGTGAWRYVSTLNDGVNTTLGISSGRIQFRTGGSDAGLIDSRRNWRFGSNALVGNNDLTTSNDVAVFGGAIRYQGGGVPVVGAYLMVADSLGNLKVSTVAVGPSSFIVGDQIQSGTTSVRTDGTGNYITMTTGSTELARLTATGLGLGTSAPQATLDVDGTAILRGDVYLDTLNSITDYVLTAQNTTGKGGWQRPLRLFSNTNNVLDEFKLDTTTKSFKATFSNSESIRLSTGGAFFGVNSLGYDIDATGFLASDTLSSRNGPLRFFLNKTTEVGRYATNGYFGLGTSTATERLTVNGNILASGSITSGSVAAGTFSGGNFSGDGYSITNIQPINVGTGSNRLDIFQYTTRQKDIELQLAISSLSTVMCSTFLGYGSGGGFSGGLTSTNLISTVAGLGSIGYLSSIPSVYISTASLVSTLNGLGTFGYLSSGGGQPALTSSLVGLGTLKYISSSQFISSGAGIQKNGIQFESSATLRFPSSIGAIAIGYKPVGDLSGAIDVSGLIFSQGLRGIQAPFGIGVGQSTTASLFGYGITGGQGWKFGVQGDIDISGNIYKNGILYSLNGMPDTYWKRTPGNSNIFFADGAVGIGVLNPSYPLDIAGKIRCYGVDVIPGPGPVTSTNQGIYVSPWQYQGSNIYFNMGSVGIGTGISSISTSISLDISGSVRHHDGRFYMEKASSTLGVGIPFGGDISGTLDVNGVTHTKYLEVEHTGIFGGRVTAEEFLSLSDRRLKQDIKRIENPWDLLGGIYGHKYKWISSGKKDIGLIAQDVLESLPEAVGGSQETGYAVAYDKLIPVLVECIRDLREQICLLSNKSSI